MSGHFDSNEDLGINKSIFENSLDAILITKLDGSILAANPTAQKMFDMSEEEIKAAGRNGIVVQVDNLETAVEERVQKGRFKAELTFKRKDNTTFPGDVTSTLFTDKDGIIKTHMNITDISDRKKAESALRRSEESYRNIMENILDAYFRADNEGKIIMASYSAARMFGFDLQEIIGLNAKSRYKNDEERDNVLKELNKHGKLIDNELELVKKDGTLFWVSQNAQYYYDNEGKIQGTETFLRDITERKKAEEKLKKSEARFRSVLQNSQDVIYRFNLQTDHYDYMSPAIRLIGFEPEDLTSMSNDEVISSVHPDDRPNLLSVLSQINQTGKGTAEYRFRGNDGIYRWWSNQMITITDSEGKPLYRDGSVRDITESKKAEDKINRRGRLLNGINTILREALTCETVKEVVEKCLEVAEYLTDSEFSFIGEINANGRLDDRALSPPAWEACEANPEKSVELLKDMEIVSYWGRVIKEGKSQIVNDPDSDPDQRGVPEGHPPITSFLGVPLNQSGQTIGMIALANKKGGYTTEDQANVEIISDAIVEAMMRKRAEIQLKNTLQDLEDIVDERTQDLLLAYKYNRNLLETALDPLVTIGPDGKITDVNKATEDVTGLSRKKLVGTDFADYFTKPDEAKAGYLKVLDEGEVRDYPLYIKHKDGGTTPVLYNASVYKDEFGKVIGVFAAARDITERKEAEKVVREYWESLEEQVELRTEELAKSNADLKQFAYVASHDLREPLRMITSFLQLLERRYRDQLDEDANEFIGFAVDGAKRLDAMIIDLLEYSRLANKEMLYTDVDMQDIIEKVIMNLNFLIDESNAQITYDSLPSVKADENMMVRLLQNLIENSIKYRRVQTPQIYVSSNNNNNNVVFSVKDNGIGIDPQHLDRIFTIFNRLHTHEEYEGTGIGLALAQRIVHQHGGEIWAESEPGKGSTFHFTIPT